MLAVMLVITTFCFSFWRDGCFSFVCSLLVFEQKAWLYGCWVEKINIDCPGFCVFKGAVRVVLYEAEIWLLFVFGRKRCGPVVWNCFLCGFPAILVRELVSGPSGPQSFMRIFHRAWPPLPFVPFWLVTAVNADALLRIELAYERWRWACISVSFLDGTQFGSQEERG